MNICSACQRGRHDHCAQQVPASGIQCECTTCWPSRSAIPSYDELLGRFAVRSEDNPCKLRNTGGSENGTCNCRSRTDCPVMPIDAAWSHLQPDLIVKNGLSDQVI